MLQELSLEQIRSLAPQAFAPSPSDKTSDKYSFLPTTRIMEDMKQLGWLVCNAKSMKSTGKNPLRSTHGKHIVEFFNPDIKIMSDDDTEAFVKIVIENNAAGWGRLKIEVGIFRLICENGMIIKDQDFGSFKLRHLGYTFEDLQTLVGQIVERLPIAVAKINTFSGIELTPTQMKDFAIKAIQVRMGQDRIVTDEEVNQVLAVRRTADEGNTLWKVFNRCQEAMIRGGSSFVDSKGKLRTLRPIKNMIMDMDINKGIWEVAEQFVG